MYVAADRALVRTTRRSIALRSGLLTAGALYLVAVVLLLFEIDRHPSYPYNWEPYTIWRMQASEGGSWTDLLAINDGLMTDSGRSPLIVVPVEIGRAFGLDGLAAIRVPIALLTGLAVPLLWIVGRRLVGHRPALLAAVLFGASPVFLTYGRTATTVGVSLVPTLLTIYVLSRLLAEGWSWRWLIALQALLVASAYAYAPIRFLWPLCVLLLLLGIRFRPDQTRRYLVAAGITLVVLPLFLVLVDDIGSGSTGVNVPSVVADYYYARGEQVIRLSQVPSRYTTYLGKSAADEDSTFVLAVRLTVRNAGDYLRLLVDRDTRPAFTDYWNSRGSLYPMFLAPLFLIGLIRVGRRAWSAPESAMLLVLFLGLGLPMLLTSKVHIGRLILTLPLQLLIVAVGFCWLVEAVISRLRGRWRLDDRAAYHVACGVLLLLVAWTTYADFYRTAASPSHGTRIEAVLRRMLPYLEDQEGVVLVVAEPLVSEVRFLMPGEFTYIDVNTQHDVTGGENRAPPLYYGVTLNQLDDPSAVPDGCDQIYVIRRADEEKFRSITRPWTDACKKQPRYRVLPI